MVFVQPLTKKLSQVESELAGKAKVGKVDCTVEADLASKYDIRGKKNTDVAQNPRKTKTPSFHFVTRTVFRLYTYN
jgi:hypothetical protein